MPRLWTHLPHPMNRSYSYRPPNAAEICLLGSIGTEVTPAGVSAALSDAGTAGRLNIRIFSVGGSMTDGWAIYNMLARHPAKEKVVTIEGMAASMASLIAMVGTEIIMPSNSYMMIHNPAVAVSGGEGDLRRAADLLQHMRSMVVNTYARRTKQSEEVIQSLMDAETYLSAEQALTLGFCDEITGPIRMAASLTPPKIEPLPAIAEAALQSRTLDAARIFRRLNARRKY